MIKDVRLGNDLEQPCLVRLQKVGTSSNGKAYARGLLEDNSGTLPFICFEAGPINRLRTMEGPTPFIIGGRVDANKYASPMGGQNLQVIVQKVVPPDGETDLSMLLPTGPIDLESLEVEFQTLIGRIQDEPLQRLVKQVFSGKRYERFLVQAHRDCRSCAGDAQNTVMRYFFRIRNWQRRIFCWFEREKPVCHSFVSALESRAFLPALPGRCCR